MTLCLVKNPENRATAEELLEHEWILSHCNSNVVDRGTELVKIGVNFWEL